MPQNSRQIKGGMKYEFAGLPSAAAERAPMARGTPPQPRLSAITAEIGRSRGL